MGSALRRWGHLLLGRGGSRVLGRVGLFRAIPLFLALAAVSAQGSVLGVLEWRGYPEQYRWRLEWTPLLEHRDGLWSPLSPGATPALRPAHVPGGGGTFTPSGWTRTFTGCDSVPVALGAWQPGALPAGHSLDGRLLTSDDASWSWWELRDPAVVWRGVERPEDLGAALTGLAGEARRVLAAALPPGLEPDPRVPWVRETLRLAQGFEGGALELVGRFRGGVRLIGGGGESSARLHVWVSAGSGERRFRYALLDLPRAGAARRERALLGALARPGRDRPEVVFAETTARGWRAVLYELLPGGVFRGTASSEWIGCPP